MAKTAQTPKTPPVPTGHIVEGTSHTVTFGDGVAFEVRQPHYDRVGRLWGEIVAKLDGVPVNQALINLLDQRHRIDFHQVAVGRDGRVDWQDYLLSLITPLQESLAGEASGGDAVSEGKADLWPTLEKKALHGLAGILTIAIDPYTEADLVAVLLNLLAGFGNLVGSGPHFRVEFTRHRLRLFVALVGPTAKARKGQSWSTPRHIFSCIDELWAKNRVTSGLSSGEGLIYHVRDQRKERQPIKEKGRVIDYEEVIVDDGESDKRLLIIEEEFAQALKVMSREGNILSPILRQAWDTGDLHPLTKTNPIRATDAHISVVGHITRDELLRHLSDTEQANGFANRFLWACVRRSKEIPDPTGIPQRILNPLIIRLRHAVEAARQIGEMRRDEDTQAQWSELYPGLTADKPGLLGAITARAEAQVMRLACIYAALDSTAIVQRPHLEAALAVWRYCEASARYIFGDSTGNPMADRILMRLQEQGPMDRTAISGLFGRNMPSARIEHALATLEQSKHIIVEPIKNAQGGRPLTVIRLAEPR
jgi:hypothetical protein